MHPTNDPRSPAPRVPSLPSDHHLWRNGRRWWIAIVLLDERGRHFRLRRSLQTTDLASARALRDVFLVRLADHPRVRPSSPGLAAAIVARVRLAALGTTPRDGTDPGSPTRRVA